MATVYLAQDLRHDRRVALKVLKPELAAVLGAERFVVEIKTTAALQHPHILPLFDSGSADSFLYYVMPYVEGETLRNKLDRETQLGIDQAVRITREVADALDYAHRHGVIHRDIKPENILLHDGRPMVADFGIALALSAAAGGRMTETGLSLGTPHYMSPEQATADKEITARADIYSLGCVLYEMLTGSPPHVGATAQQIIMKIVTEEAAPVTRLRKSVPPNVAAAVTKAVERLPADRFESARAFADALANPAFTAAGPGEARPVPLLREWRHRVAVPALVALGLALVGLFWAVKRQAAPAPLTRYRVALDSKLGLSGSTWLRIAVSPDGSKLVYVGDSERGTQLFLRTRDHLDGVALPGTEGAINPAFAPDGDHVAFMDRPSGGRIKVIALSGGAPVVITDSASGAPGVAWGSDGFIYYDRSGIGPLMRVPAAGGKAQGIGQLDSARKELQHSWPDVLPNGKGVIMTVSHRAPGFMGAADDEIGVLDLATGKHRVLLRGVFARYARSGHLVYAAADGSLMAAPFDQDRLEVTGDPVALGESLEVRVGGGGVDLALSANGTLWFVAGGVEWGGSYEAVWVGRDGSATPIPGVRGLLTDPALSPDGKRLAVSVREIGTDVFIKELEHGPLSKLTVGGGDHLRPIWLRDGRSVAYISGSTSNHDLTQQLADGSRPPALLLHAAKSIEEVAFSPDGIWMLYRVGFTRGERKLFARRLGTDSSIALLSSSADETSPALSPDGHWLAYASNESGTAEVYVRPFPNTADGKWQISTSGGQEPVWAHSGRELFYRAIGRSEAQSRSVSAADSQMVIQVTTGKSFVPGARRALFSLNRFALGPDHQQYAISPDDRRFVMIRAPETARSAPLIVVENFFELLRTRVGR